jgi:hypothetical protein
MTTSLLYKSKYDHNTTNNIKHLQIDTNILQVLTSTNEGSTFTLNAKQIFCTILTPNILSVR